MSDEYQKVKLGALWLNTSKGGKQYWSGKMEANIQMWPNSNKREGHKDPDFIIYASEKKVARESKLAVMDFGREELYVAPKTIKDEEIPF